MEMAKYILQILKSRIFIIMSWGFHHPVAIENGLRFNVNGFIHQGKVEVIYNASSDLFEVRLLNTDGSIKEQTSDVYLDCLVNVIDGMAKILNIEHENLADIIYNNTIEMLKNGQTA